MTQDVNMFYFEECLIICAHPQNIKCSARNKQ